MMRGAISNNNGSQKKIKKSSSQKVVCVMMLVVMVMMVMNGVMISEAQDVTAVSRGGNAAAEERWFRRNPSPAPAPAPEPVCPDLDLSTAPTDVFLPESSFAACDRLALAELYTNGVGLLQPSRLRATAVLADGTTTTLTGDLSAADNYEFTIPTAVLSEEAPQVVIELDFFIGGVSESTSQTLAFGTGSTETGVVSLVPYPTNEKDIVRFSGSIVFPNAGVAPGDGGPGDAAGPISFDVDFVVFTDCCAITGGEVTLSQTGELALGTNWQFVAQFDDLTSA